MKLSILEGDSWTKRTARSGFPILVEYVRNRREITYGEWDDQIVSRGLGSHVMAVQYGYPAGSIGDACEAYTKKTGVPVPQINLMVVNASTRVPGSGANSYFSRFCASFLNRDINPKELSVREKRALIERAHEEIFDFPSWHDVLNACGLTETETERPMPKRRRPRRSGWKKGPEGEAHKSLKRQVAENPGLIGLKSNEKGKEEIPLWSGDRVDVLFERAATGVEVKTADAGFDEIHRGIFQCVKYKAVLRAQQVYERRIPTADCVLALGGPLPEELQEILTLFRVRCYARLAE